jgi:1-deoxy-D-xylulose-5-phosphate reductoisomerase
VIINAANEIAVAEYLKEKIGFYDIPNIIEKALKEFANTNIHKIDELLEFDNEIRKYCLQLS